jgi:hypothetical protein
MLILLGVVALEPHHDDASVVVVIVSELLAGQLGKVDGGFLGREHRTSAQQRGGGSKGIESLHGRSSSRAFAAHGDATSDLEEWEQEKDGRRICGSLTAAFLGGAIERIG